jgi:hypothetical protein
MGGTEVEHSAHRPEVEGSSLVRGLVLAAGTGS